MPNYSRRNYYGMNSGYPQPNGPHARVGEVTPSCSKCRPDDPMDGMPIAMAYVPWQSWECIYDYAKGFERGTIFEKLDKPFIGKGGCPR